MIIRLSILLLLFANTALAANLAIAGNHSYGSKKKESAAVAEDLRPCSKPKPKIGSWDFRDRSERAEKIHRMVLGAHFTPSAQQLIAGNTGSLTADLDYVLRHIPNHPRALYLMAKHQDSDKFSPRMRADRRDYIWPTTKCYFQRAREFAPDDPAIYLAFAVYYHQIKHLDLALESYLKAVELFPKYAEAQYNLGLLYMDLKDRENAQKHADIAYELGYPMTGLKERLKREK